MKKKIFITFSFFLFTFYFLFAHPAFAAYVLPYPSVMPGNKIYKISRIVDEFKKWWYQGNISQLKYHMSLADKYLVEGKTLCEYGQYALGVDALKRSDTQISYILSNIQEAEKEGKDMSAFRLLAQDAMKEHERVLTSLKMSVPATLEWKEERQVGVQIFLHAILDESFMIRDLVLKSLET